jgi:hypothetical protein
MAVGNDGLFAAKKRGRLSIKERRPLLCNFFLFKDVFYTDLHLPARS